MENLEILKPAQFSEEIKKVKEEEFITAAIENEIKRKLLNNDIFLKHLIETLEEKWKKAGMLTEALEHTSINEAFTFEDLISKKEITFFTNWSDFTNFPKLYGSGIFLPGFDTRCNSIIYTTSPTPHQKDFRHVYVGYIFIAEEEGDNQGLTTGVEWKQLMTHDEVSNSNLLINPDFKICQRNMEEYITNKTDNGGRYYPDRWICRRDYNDVGLQYKIEEDGLHAKFMTTTGSWGSILYRMDLESAKVLSGKTITISGKIKTSSSNIRGINLYQGSTYIVNGAPKKIGEDFYTVTAKMPEITDNLVLEIRFDGTENGESIFEYLKLELGSIATPFVPPDRATELLKCKRYYQRIGVPEGDYNAIIHHITSYTSASTKQYITFYVDMEQEMRVAPTVKLYGTPNKDTGYSIANVDGNSPDNSMQWSYSAQSNGNKMFRIIAYNESTDKRFDQTIFTTKHLVFYTNSGVELDAEIH